MSEFTLSKSSKGVYKEKGSSFHVASEPVSSIEQVKSKLLTLRKHFQSASHICYAYRIKLGECLDEFSADSGEPKGSAGIPILNVLKRKKLVNTAVFVIRYFGGTKLGIPGLIHAYSKATENSISNKIIKPWIKNSVLSLNYQYEIQKKVESIIQQYGAKIKKQKFFLIT